MENISDWIYHHKTLLIMFLIICIGSIGSVFALTMESDRVEEIEEMISDSKTEETIVEPSNEIESKEEIEDNVWTIDVKGAVNNPNVYKVPIGTRIYEILDIAGGLTDEATTENINLSKKVTDEMVIYIYKQDEYIAKNKCIVTNEYYGEISKEITEKTSIISETEKNETKKININTATQEELMTINGLGEKKVANIIEYRKEHKSFKKIEELKEVNGIGEALYEKIKNYCTIE